MDRIFPFLLFRVHPAQPNRSFNTIDSLLVHQPKFFPPPFVLPVGNALHTPQPQDEPAFMRMPEPFQSLPRSPAYSSMAPVSSPYLPNYTQWYLGAEISPLHSQSVRQGVMKVPGYDPKGYAQAIKGADTREESERNRRGLDTGMASAVVIYAHSTADIRFAAVYPASIHCLHF